MAGDKSCVDPITCRVFVLVFPFEGTSANEIKFQDKDRTYYKQIFVILRIKICIGT